jgi:hypothetical protein
MPTLFCCDQLFQSYNVQEEWLVFKYKRQFLIPLTYRVSIINRGALPEGSAQAVACSLGLGLWGFSIFIFPFRLVISNVFRVRNLKFSIIIPLHLFLIKFQQEKAMEATKQKEEERENPKPREQEGMPQHQHCPPAKRRGDTCWNHSLDMVSSIADGGKVHIRTSLELLPLIWWDITFTCKKFNLGY